LELNTDTPIQAIELPWLREASIGLLMKRDDLIHPFISGNKWRKLKYNIEEAQRQGKGCITTFGGAYSNHLIATACAGAIYGLKTIGIVRGEELNSSSNLVLKIAAEFGMDLQFVARDVFKDLINIGSAHSCFKESFPSFVIPDGGSNELGVKGCMEILNKNEALDFDHILLPVGTATTMCGMVCTPGLKAHVHGIAAVKDDERHQSELLKYCSHRIGDYTLHTNYDFGGFGKSNGALRQFARSFAASTGILLDPVYNAKAMMALFQMVKNGEIPRGSRVLYINTGGLTGILSNAWLKQDVL
jgi:1-aminocyclopropane-1-carboxylate deaminase